MQPFRTVERPGEREALIVSSAENFLLQPFGIPASNVLHAAFEDGNMACDLSKCCAILYISYARYLVS